MTTSYKAPGLSRQNQLLAALPKEDLDRWQARMELVELSPHQELWDVGRSPEYVYFPTTAIVSLMSLTLEGASAEVAVIGNDGLAGITALLGSTSATAAVVYSAGRAFRVSSRFVRSEMDNASGVMKVVMGYAQSVMTQMAQQAVCNRFHSIEQQLSRRLLVGMDHLASDELEMTHELAANLLGVRREGVTMAANRLQKEGLIRYRRGHVVILDREGLEHKTCECYAVTQKIFSRLLPLPLAA